MTINTNLVGCDVFTRLLNESIDDFDCGEIFPIFVMPKQGFCFTSTSDYSMQLVGTKDGTPNTTEILTPSLQNANTNGGYAVYFFIKTGANSLAFSNNNAFANTSTVCNRWDIDTLQINIVANAVNYPYGTYQIGGTLTGCEFAPMTKNPCYLKTYANANIGCMLFIAVDNNKRFTQSPSYTYTNTSNVSVTKYLTSFSGNKNVINGKTIYLANTANNNKAVTITASASNIPVPPMTVQNLLDNATVDNTAFDTSSNANSYTITPDTGYSFDTPPILRINNNGVFVDLSFTENGGVWILTVDGTQYQNAINVYLMGSATVPPQTKNIVLTGLVNMGVTSNSDTEIANNKTNYHFEIAIYDGFELDGTIYFNYKTQYSTGRQALTYDSQNDVYKCDIDLQVMGYTAQSFFDLQQGYNLPSLTGNAIARVPIISDFGIVRAYKVTKAINADLKTKRFYNFQTDQFEDLGRYIVGMFRYPFTVDTTNTTTIKLGFYDTNINAPITDKQFYSVSLGKQAVNGIYQDSSDIAQCEIVLQLPYYGIHKIDSKYINTEIEVIYKTDILANNTDILIFSNDNLIETLNTKIGYSVPYILLTDKVNIENVDFDTNFMKDYDPKIFVRQKAKVSGTYNQTNVRIDLDEITGFIRCQNVVMNISAKMTETEKNLLLVNLANGVFM